MKDDAENGAAETVRLTLTSAPCDVPFPLRLRQALKSLLRSYRLRCIEIEWLDDPERHLERESPLNRRLGPANGI